MYSGPEVITFFPCSAQLSMKFFLLIGVEMPTITASVLVVFVMFCVHMYSFAVLIRGRHRRRSVTLQSPTTTLIPLFPELTGCGYHGLLDRKNRSDMCPRWESKPRLPACKVSTLSTRPGSPLNWSDTVCS